LVELTRLERPSTRLLIEQNQAPRARALRRTRFLGVVALVIAV
jgi:hypothetical protein